MAKDTRQEESHISYDDVIEMYSDEFSKLLAANVESGKAIERERVLRLVDEALQEGEYDTAWNPMVDAVLNDLRAAIESGEESEAK